MLDLGQAKNIAVIGGGLSGWLSALMLRRVFSANVDIAVFEDPK
ncbi:tryptophan 7-halogenase [Bartonella sp. W8097]|nr:tryptophan 7-halogenase [Bartonella apihabitans]MBI0021673.1 tryptophan 7-halogenase [Bartonella apihabitans]